MKDKEIKFAEWLAQNHYVLYDIKLGICFWENEDDVDSSEKLYKQFENEIMKDKIYEQRDVQWTTNSTEPRPIKDFIVESVIDQFKDRSNVGIKKYGTTLDREDLTMLEWLIHLQQELMDATLYIEKLKSKLDFKL